MTKRVRAIIVTKGRLILIKRVKSDGIFWVLPGGAVDTGETLKQALRREIKEETGLNVKVGRLIWRGVSRKPTTFGQREYYFTCTKTGGQLGSGQGPEFQPNNRYSGQHIVEAASRNRLIKLKFKPKEIQTKLVELLSAR